MPRYLACALFLLASGCSLFAVPDRFGARSVTFEALEGWEADDHGAALSAFLVACPRMAEKAGPLPALNPLSVSPSVWRSLCHEARLAEGKKQQAKHFFESRFVPFRIDNRGREQGLFTGYYEPVLYGALHRHGDFMYPLYGPPPELRAGEDFFSRADINAGALSGRGLEIAWVDDPVMLFFMQIQGSGRLKLENGQEIFIGYAGGNGHRYTALGKVMAEEGLIPRESMNFFTLRGWLYQHRDRAREMMERNASYVFFQRRERPAIGAAGSSLVPGRSLAVDSRYIPYGLPVYLETQAPGPAAADPMIDFRRLMVAHDTGSAIRSPVRGDIFFGSGDEAEYKAGYMKAEGVYTLLVPHEAVQPWRVWLSAR